MAEIKLGGDILSIETPDTVKTVIEQWKKEKKIGPSLMAAILNSALSKCYVQALMISKEMNLPSPMPLPRVNVSKEKASKYVA